MLIEVLFIYMLLNCRWECDACNGVCVCFHCVSENDRNCLFLFALSLSPFAFDLNAARARFDGFDKYSVYESVPGKNALTNAELSNIYLQTARAHCKGCEKIEHNANITGDFVL